MPPQQRRAVAARGDGDDARAAFVGDLLRAVGAAVVGDDHLAVDAVSASEALRLVDAGAERLGLVQARQHDREFEFFRRRHRAV